MTSLAEIYGGVTPTEITNKHTNNSKSKQQFSFSKSARMSVHKK